MSGKKSKLSRTFPTRVKNESKPRSQLPFKRFADFLTLRRKKKKHDDGSSSLEKQVWFHGKINAEYAEMILKKSGEFLVREDPAMPGAWFIAVRTRDDSLHLAINKLKSSKGTRFKYRIEDSDFVFDSICELIRFYVNERRPVCIRPPAVITIAVGKEAALLSEEDFRGRFATAGSARLSRSSRKLERKASDPTLSSRVPSRLYEEIDSTPVVEQSDLKSDPPRVAVNGNGTLKIEKRKTSVDHSIQTSPRSRSMDNVLDDSTSGPKDWAESSMSSTYDSPRSIAMPASPPFKTPFTQQEKKRKNIDPSLFESDTDYATPSSIPASTEDEQVSRDMNYDIPRMNVSEGSKSPLNDKNIKNAYTNQIKRQDSKREESQDNEPKPMAQDDRHNIYLTVVNKLRDTVIQPFLQNDCVTLARHLTKVDLEVVWRDSDGEDEDGGAKGLERLVLPQGREKRCSVLERYQNLTYWVGALVIAAGEMASRAQMVSKLIELADVLSDKQGNLVSFMAIIDGLALPQVSRLHHTWSCLHHQFSSSAVLIHSTLKPLAGLLSSGAPSPFPGVCLPYMVPLARLLETTSDSTIEGLVEDDESHGLEVVLAHLSAGRTLIQQVEVFKNEAERKLAFEGENSHLLQYFREGINVSKVLGVNSDPLSRTQKLMTLLTWLSENVEHGSMQTL